MTLAQKSRNWTLAAALLLGMATPALAQTIPPSTTSDADAATRDALRTGGCTGCFDTQMQAAISQFSDIKRVFRNCNKGAQFTGANCDGGGAGGGAFGDFVELQGNLRNKTTDAAGLGVPGGATDVTVRVSANGSSNGITCASATSPGPIGFIAPEGFDGVPNTLDDAGGTGVFGAVGPGLGAGPGPATGGPGDRAPALTTCTGTIAKYNLAPPGTTPTVFSGSGTNEFCIVEVDANNNAAIANDRAGAAAPGAITALGQLDANNETTNLKLTCDLGFADLPPTDFIQASLNTLTFSGQQLFGAQIFKMIAAKDVHANGTANKKVNLQDPQIEGMFNGWAANTVCSWQQVGAQSALPPSTVTPNPPNPPIITGTDINVCYRTLGSGTREVFRNTWDANTKGDAAQGAAGLVGDPGLSQACGQRVGSLTGGAVFRVKTLIEGGGTSDVVNCVKTHTGSIGYVDAFISVAGTNFYSVPLEGVDPDTNDLKLLTRCGLYRYWGPLAGGSGSRLGLVPPATTPFRTAHTDGMKNPNLYLAGGFADSYLPLSGLNFTKSATDGPYTSQFISTANGDPAMCPGAINPVGTIPP